MYGGIHIFINHDMELFINMYISIGVCLDVLIHVNKIPPSKISHN